MPIRRFDLAYREHGALISVELPGGTPSGGLLVDDGDRRVLVLFGEEEVEADDEVVIGPGRSLTVLSVRHGTLNGHRVTALEVRDRPPRPQGRAG